MAGFPSSWRAHDAWPPDGTESYEIDPQAATAATRPPWQSALGDALDGATSVAAVLDTLLRQATRLAGPSGALALLPEARTGMLRLVAECGEGEVRHLLGGREQLPMDARHPLAEAARSGRSLWAGSELLHQRWPSPGDMDRYLGTGSLVVLPLLIGGDVAAVVALLFAADVQPSEGQLERLSALAVLGARALDRAQLAEAAHAAAEAKSAFLTMMSHELRTPLNAIMGYTSLLADEIVGPLNPTQREQLGRVQGQAQHLLTLIEELLSLTRAEGGPGELRFERVAPDVLVDSVLPLVVPLAARKGLELRWGRAQAVKAILTDPDRVRQVLIHLLTNAIKFTDAGSVTVELEETGEPGHRSVDFVVRDTGAGIAARDTERIFEPFWQLSHTHARRPPGTGLGLHVARRIARLLGGDIVLESRPGEGSSFTLRLPALGE